MFSNLVLHHIRALSARPLSRQLSRSFSTNNLFLFNRSTPLITNLSKQLFQRYASTTTKRYSLFHWRRYFRPRLLIGSTLFMSVGGAGLWYWDEHYNSRTLIRLGRTAWNGIAIAVDYKLNFDKENVESIRALHGRAAERLLNVCINNGGLYIKMGQAVGVQSSMLPKPYKALAKLFDSADPVSYDQIREVIYEETGKWPEEMFQEFDKVPIASASVAQVHRAVLNTGEQVAVKVQRPDIKKHAESDIVAYRLFMKLYEAAFDLPLDSMTNYVAKQIKTEMDFIHEAENQNLIRQAVLLDSETSRSSFLSNFFFWKWGAKSVDINAANSANWAGSIYVPKVHPELSTRRLLVMEYIEDAARLTDSERIEGQMHLKVDRIMYDVCDVLGKQIFKWGLVNADPHPANVLVRKHPLDDKQHQVVLIDHGLLIRLPETFRAQYCEMWSALFTWNIKSIERICNDWGLRFNTDYTELIASMMSLRVPERAQGIERKKIALDNEAQIKELVKDLLIDFDRVPQDLIFIGRSMEIVRGNNRALGNQVERINLLAKRAALENRRLVLTASNTSSEYLSAWTNYLEFRAAIAGISAAFSMIGIWDLVSQSVMAMLGVPKAKKKPVLQSFEEELQKMAEDMGFEIDESTWED